MEKLHNSRNNYNKRTLLKKNFLYFKTSVTTQNNTRLFSRTHIEKGQVLMQKSVTTLKMAVFHKTLTQPELNVFDNNVTNQKVSF